MPMMQKYYDTWNTKDKFGIGKVHDNLMSGCLYLPVRTQFLVLANTKCKLIEDASVLHIYNFLVVLHAQKV